MFHPLECIEKIKHELLEINYSILTNNTIRRIVSCDEQLALKVIRQECILQKEKVNNLEKLIISDNSFNRTIVLEKNKLEIVNKINQEHNAEIKKETKDLIEAIKSIFNSKDILLISILILINFPLHSENISKIMYKFNQKNYIF